MIATKYSTVPDALDAVKPWFGDFADDFDLDAILDEAFEYDPDQDGFVLAVDDDEFAAIAARHDTTCRGIAYGDMLAQCRDSREADGFCSVCSSCSGPSFSNLACDHPFPDGSIVFRGGNRGGCRFVVDATTMPGYEEAAR